jgi:hypothetical protein
MPNSAQQVVSPRQRIAKLMDYAPQTERVARRQYQTACASESSRFCARNRQPRPEPRRSGPGTRQRRAGRSLGQIRATPLLQTRRRCVGGFLTRARRRRDLDSETRTRRLRVRARPTDGPIEYGAKRGVTAKWLLRNRREQFQCTQALTLVACRKVTNGRFDLAAISCSEPMILPLFMSTAAPYQHTNDPTHKRTLTQRVEIQRDVHALLHVL